MTNVDREGQIEIANILRNAGLEQKEIQVYLALIALGPSVVSAISKATNLNRATLYFVLERLEQKNFVHEVVEGKIRHFAAKSPEEILGHLHEKQESLRLLENQMTEAMPIFQAISKGQSGAPITASYKGLNAIKPLYREILQNEFFATFNLDSMYQAFGTTIADALFGKNYALQGKDLIIDTQSARKIVSNWKQTKSYQFKMLPSNMNFKCDLIGWKDSVALFTYDLDYTTIVIKNQQVHNLLKQWFDALWNVSNDL